MQKKLANLIEESKKIGVDTINAGIKKDEDDLSFKDKIEHVSVEVLKTQGNVQFARKEEDNLKIEINNDNIANDD
jgi:hypothetical protein